MTPKTSKSTNTVRIIEGSTFYLPLLLSHYSGLMLFTKKQGYRVTGSPEGVARIKSQEFKRLKDSRCERHFRGTERGHGAKAFVDIGRPARAEIELVDVTAEDRRLQEAAIGARSVFITGAVDTEVIVLGEAFRMRQDHDPDREGSEAELIGLEDLTSATSGTSTMTQTELRGNHEDVVIRLFGGELLEEANRTLVLPEVLAAEFTIAVVGEVILAGLLQRFQHLLDGLVVGHCYALPLRDSEPSFGVLREFCFSKLLVGEADTWEELAQNVGLLRDAFHLVTFGVHGVRRRFFVLVLVRDGQFLQRVHFR